MAKKAKGHKGRESGGEPRVAASGPDEAGFLAEYDAAEFSHPSLTVDVVLLTATEDSLAALLIRRERHPELGKWALPGGFVKLDESLDAAAARVVKEKAGLRGVFLEQLYTFGEIGRDPRTRVITVAYPGWTARSTTGTPSADEMRRDLQAVAAGRMPTGVEIAGATGAGLPLAFDHAEVLGMAVKRLRGKLDYAPIGFQLLPDAFSLRALQQIHETISGRHLNKDSFRRRMLASGQLEGTGERRTDVEYRPPELYRFVAPTQE